MKPLLGCFGIVLVLLIGLFSWEHCRYVRWSKSDNQVALLKEQFANLNCDMIAIEAANGGHIFWPAYKEFKISADKACLASLKERAIESGFTNASEPHCLHSDNGSDYEVFCFEKRRTFVIWGRYSR